MPARRPVSAAARSVSTPARVPIGTTARDSFSSTTRSSRGSSAAKYASDGKPSRFDHIAFAATDLPGVRKRLESRKVKFREQVVPRTGAAQIFLYDPDGVGVELNFPPEEAKA